MLDQIFANRISQYSPDADQLSVCTEVLQEIVLAALSDSGFFDHAEFHGGTCLRIFFGLDRFSEDLDFALKAPDSSFRWSPYLNRIVNQCRQFGIDFEVAEKQALPATVQKAFLKTDSAGAMLLFNMQTRQAAGRKIRIKLEVDTNPPAGALVRLAYLSFPVAAAVAIHTLESSFATKSHALLCREYLKGRDWYDFLWYASRGTRPDFPLLSNALRQMGPWSGTKVAVNTPWYLDAMSRRISAIDWKIAAEDVRRFLPLSRQKMLDSWSADFFLDHLSRLAPRWENAR
jgi:predicted nucleotidyltransferase component of viral defense system